MMGQTNAINAINGQYEQLVNYAMLYDYGDECLNVGNEWTSYTDGSGTLTKNDDNMTLHLNVSSYAGKRIYASKKIGNLDSSQYNKYGIISHIKGSCYRLSVTLNGTEYFIFKLSETDVPSDTAGYKIRNRDEDVKRIYDLSNTALSSMGVQYYCYSEYPTMTVNIYALFLTKPDDVETLANLAGISATSIDEILSNSTLLLSNRGAVEFMIKQCTGDFMASAILSQTFLTALNNSQYKTIIMANKHWSKFLNMVV